MTLVARTVSLSHDNSTWVDVSAAVTGLVRWSAGMSTTLGEWEPGTASFGLTATDRAYDPLNDAATFQPRQGDYLNIDLAGSAAFRGRVNAIVPKYVINGPTVLASLQISAVDAVGDLGAGRSEATTTVQPYKAGTWVDAAINDPFTPWFAGTTSIAAGDVSTTSVDGGNPLEVVQTLTRTEGGAAQLFVSKAGVLTWRGRYSRPSQTVAFGSGGIKIVDFGTLQDSQWANRVNITPIAHIDTQASASSVTTGTGTKTFTLTTPPPIGDTWGFSAGATVAISSIGSANTMSGTVTSYDETTRVLVCDITTKSGTATRTDWLLDFEEPSSMQSAADAQSNTKYGTWRAKDLATYHRTRPAALAEAKIRAAEMAHPPRRLEWIDVDLGACTSGEATTVLGLAIGDAAKVVLAFGSGTPATLTEYRFVVGYQHTQQETSQVVRFVLGRAPTYDFTPTLKQNGTVASTKNQAVYTVNNGWCTAKWYATSTASGTTNNAITVDASLPTPLDSSHLAMGLAEFYDLSGTLALVTAAGYNGTSISFSRHNTSSAIGVSPNFAVASGDVTSGVILYPVTQGSTFTVALAQAGARSSTLNTKTFSQRDGRCLAMFRLTASATGSAGNAITATPTGLPTISPSNDAVGTFVYERGSTKYRGSVRYFAGVLYFAAHNSTSDLGSSPSFAIQINDVLHVTLDYPIS